MSNRALTTEQRIFLLKHWWMSGKSLHAVNTAFKHEFPDDAVPQLDKQLIDYRASLRKQVLSITHREVADHNQSQRTTMLILSLKTFVGIHMHHKDVLHVSLTYRVRAYNAS